ncbi:MAG TPA: NAD(P)-binding domain-containing protein [Azonexus sp.]|nr:NAD(P)-binding domain-containing protein [Azonexus sp.]
MNIGFIGLGLMGRPLALHLAQAGHTLHLRGRDSEFLNAPVSGGDRATLQRDRRQRHGRGRFNRRAHISGNPIDAAMIRVGFAGIGAGAARDCSSYWNVQATQPIDTSNEGASHAQQSSIEPRRRDAHRCRVS